MSLRYMLDTNIISDLVRRLGGTVATRIADVGVNSVLTIAYFDHLRLPRLS